MLSTEMNWEVVQDFLNVSGIKGVSLIDGESRPYFQDIETVLNIQQRDSVSQGVWEILKTIPETFYAFEFQFLGTQAYIHKIHPGLILLVLTQDSLIYPDYCEAFTRLKAEFEANTEATLESFRKLLVARTPVTVSKGKAIAQAMVEEITEQNGRGRRSVHHSSSNCDTPSTFARHGCSTAASAAARCPGTRSPGIRCPRTRCSASCSAQARARRYTARLVS